MTAIATASPSVQRRSFGEVWVITIGHALTHWYPATFYLLLPVIGKELGLSYAEIGTILSCQYFAGAISNIPGGILVDSIGRKGLLMALSLFWVGVPYLLMGCTSSYWMLLACSTLVGIGNNLWHPTAIPLLGHRFPERRGLVMSFHAMGGNVGDAVAPLAAGALLAIFTWRQVVVMNVVPGILMSAIILLYLGRLREGTQSEKAGIAPARSELKVVLGGLRQLLANKTLLLLSLSSAFRSMTERALLTFLPLFLAGQMGYPLAWVGGWMFALQMAGFLAAPIGGHLSDQMGRRRIIMSSMAMTGVVLVFMAVAGHSVAFVFFIAFLGFFLYATRAVLQAWLLETTPKSMGGTSIGILFGTQALGAAIGPFVSGLIADQYGLMATFYFLAGTIVVANLFVFFTPADRELQLAGR
jgi:MFS family permease